MYIPVALLKANEDKHFMPADQIAKRKAEISSEDAIQLDGTARALQRRAMLATAAAEDLDDAFERYIGDNDLLPINYLQIGYLRSKAVGRLRYFDTRINRNAMATGFLISPDLVLTNHHVFSDPTAFRDAFMDFDYAYGPDGRELTRVVFRIDPGKVFLSNPELDCALIGIAANDESGSVSSRDRAYLALNANLGKAGIGDSATIIQYPDGNYQQIALRQNQILDIKDDAILYVSDTAPGSSGSPVFNDQWQVIALHSAGVAKKDGQGQYFDKNDQPIPVVDGHIDASQLVWISNTGIRVSSLVTTWLAQPQLKANPYVQFLGSAEYAARGMSPAVAPVPPKAADAESVSRENPMSADRSPIDDLRNQGITININIGRPSSLGEASVAAVAASVPQVDGNALETKVDDEQNMDYSGCTGFDLMFMGFRTDLPKLDSQLKRKVAPLTHNANQFVLKYDHYSTVHHSVRRMPIVSAINVEGNPKLRKDNAPRKDKWLRDNRIDLTVQLTDDFYKNSGFDKGHMSRREDAKWGTTAAVAEEAAQLTCMYTNACPQVPDINRAVYGYHGLWGQLEQIVLEQGVEPEDGKASRICVFNGPLFVGTDPVFKGVQVPMRFFKLIVWLNGKGDKKATAFVLSQEDLVGGIQFEELQFDKKFIEHQCSIAYLEKMTSLTFDGINQFDTSPDKGDAAAVGKIDQEALEAHLAKHR